MSRETEEREKGAEQALALGERRRLIYGLQLWAQVRGQESRELVSAGVQGEPGCM